MAGIRLLAVGYILVLLGRVPAVAQPESVALDVEVQDTLRQASPALEVPTLVGRLSQASSDVAQAGV